MLLDIRERALALVTQYVGEARLSQRVASCYKTQQELALISSILKDRIMAKEGFVNPAFNGLGDATALCFVLYERDPGAYAKLISGVASFEDAWFLETYEGLLQLVSFIQGLSDDHEYLFNEARDTIEHRSDLTGHLPGLTPAKFRSIMLAKWESGLPGTYKLEGSGSPTQQG